MSTCTRLRLDGLEYDNLLAFLCLLGVLRALERTAPAWAPRVAWDVARPPWRPVLVLPGDVERSDVTAAVMGGVEALAPSHDFEGRDKLDYTRDEARGMLQASARESAASDRARADLLAALMSDGACKDKDDTVDPTPLCLLFGQGWQCFLERLARVPRELGAPPGGVSRRLGDGAGARCIEEALFAPWQREDETASFRWDPEEAARYALQAGDPTSPDYKRATQHGANCLAAVGLAELTVAPRYKRERVRATLICGDTDATGFSIAWPVWRDPIRLHGVRALLAHPGLRVPGALGHLGVVQVMVARRYSLGKFMNFARADAAW